MKIKKEQLKLIIKECLIELLQDGLGNALTGNVAQKLTYENRNRDLEPLPGQRRQHHVSTVDPAAVRRRTMELSEGRPIPSPIIQQMQQQKQPLPGVDLFSDNPVMASIFADTAATTYREQESPGTSHAADPAARAVAVADPVELFGENRIDIWNKAAFAPSKPGLMASPIALDLLKQG